VIIWDLYKKTKIASFKIAAKSIRTVTLSKDGTVMCFIGVD